MMNSLFISFDPSLNFIDPFLSTSLILLLFCFPMLKVSFFKSSKISLKKELMATANSKSKNILHFLLVLFMSLLFLNILGLLNFVFSTTAHIMMILSFSLFMWTSLIAVKFSKSFNSFFSHLVPDNCPKPLILFMVFIETVSAVIRPFTLAIRLSANLTTGHILLSLIDKTFNIMSFWSMPLLLLIFLEMAVALIQAYVFTTLISMYLQE